MIRHIVMWKFREGTEAQQQEFLTRLAGLYGVIPQIKASTVARNVGPDGNYDAVLVSDFDSMDDVLAYRDDPRHVAVAALCKDIRTSRVAIDHEL